MRVAIVTAGADSLTQVQAYMPGNYQVESYFVNGSDVLVITGEDHAGWTLDGYVIPRLASGLIWATEIGVQS